MVCGVFQSERRRGIVAFVYIVGLIVKQTLVKSLMSNYFKGNAHPWGNAKLFQMGFWGSARKNIWNGLGMAIFGS